MTVAIISAALCLEEKVPFWNLAAIKTWNSYLLPKNQQTEWRLGLGAFTSLINKKSKASLILSDDETSNVTLTSFSVIDLGGSSTVRLAPHARLNLSDHSELTGHDLTAVEIAENSVVSAQRRSSLTPGNLVIERDAVFTLSEAQFNGLLSKLVVSNSASLNLASNSRLTLIAGSSFQLGSGSTLQMSKSDLDIAGDVSTGERCKLTFTGLEWTMVGGKVNLGDQVEFKAESKSAFTTFGAVLNFTEGSKITLQGQSEFNVERNSSLIMARRDLRLLVEEKGFLKIEQSSNCLMTDDLTVRKQTTTQFNAESVTSSIRCFAKYEQLVDEKLRRFPGQH